MPASNPSETRPAPQLYLVTSPVNDAAAARRALEEAFAATPVAAVLLRLADADERAQINTAKSLARIVQAHDAALLLDGLPGLAARAGADGAHLESVAAFETAAASLKPDRIAGVGGLTSRHDAMHAAEQNADYVMFGEPDPHGHRPSLDAILERVEWWAEVFQTPCVAYAADVNEIDLFARAGAEFIALDPSIWADRPRAALADAVSRMALPENVA